MSIKVSLLAIGLVAAIQCWHIGNSFQVLPAPKFAFVLPRPINSRHFLSASDDEKIDEPNPPNWLISVIVLTPDMSHETIAALVKPTQDSVETGKTNPRDMNEILYNAERHFVEDRYALLFAPGTYTNDIEVGYYTQLAGLGAKAEDVIFKDCDYGPYCPALRKWETIGGCQGLSLDTFWRAAENYKTEAKKGQLWAVSQAAPICRVHVVGNTYLHDEGAQASGGHMANSFIDGKLFFGSQQQWCCRSVHINGTHYPLPPFTPNPPGNHDYGAWSNVFIDCVGIEPKTSELKVLHEGKNTERRVTVTVDIPKVTVEKPFIAMKEDNTYELRVPAPRVRMNTSSALGPDLDGLNDEVCDFTRVFVARANHKQENGADGTPDLEVAAKINEALKASKDVVLSPGKYYLSEPIEISSHNQTVLGLGLATLVAPTDGRPCIHVMPYIKGVRVAGIMLEASVIKNKSPTAIASFIEIGNSTLEEPDLGNPENPCVLTDIFARVGGSNLDRTVSTDIMIRIHSGNVVGDNLWLWRADHVKLCPDEKPNVEGLDYHQTTSGEVPVATGLYVGGDDVMIHGLAVEHTMQDQVIWKGKRGNVQFYQCELPYDVTPDFGYFGFVGYKVDASSHTAGGVGVYSNFRDHCVPVETAFTHPESVNVHFTFPWTIRLNNNGAIKSIINGKGAPAFVKGQPVQWIENEN